MTESETFGFRVAKVPEPGTGLNRPWLAVLADANTAEWGVVDRKAGARITELHESYREAIDEAIQRLRTW